MKILSISTELWFPLDAATQTFAFIGRKGSGKTYGSGKLTELLIQAGIQVAILDTVGNWYGLRLSADGKADGIDIPIVGGLRGDIPLEPTGGHLIADVIVDSGRSMIIDASQFTKADRQRFATAFGERLWKRKKAEKEPTPIMLILEESQLIIPENVRGESAAMVGIYEEIIRLGRNYGIGVTMITQRPQSVNKEVLNQTECLMVFQVNGAHERKALRDWIVHQGMDVSLLNELPSLKPGECFVWSPQWLSVLKKIKISPKKTFDSTSTPKAGGTFRGRALKAINLDALQEKMKETIEKAKADDPKELKKQIADLKKQIAAKQKPQAPEKIEVPAVSQPDIDRIAHLYDDFKTVSQNIMNALVAVLKLKYHEKPKPVVITEPMPRRQPSRPVVKNSPPDSSFGKCEREILKFLSLREGNYFNKVQIGTMIGYSHNSGGFNNALSKLNANNLISKRGSDIAVNSSVIDSVKQILGDEYNAPEQQSLEQWLSKLGKCEREIYRVLLENSDAKYSREQLGNITGYSHNSGGFNNAVSKLNTLGLIQRDSGYIQLNQQLLGI